MDRCSHRIRLRTIQSIGLGKGHGGAPNMGASGRRGRYRGGGRGGGRGAYGRVNEVSGHVDLCVRLLCGTREDQRIGDDIFSMVNAMDSRALSKLLKELSRMVRLCSPIP